MEGKNAIPDYEILKKQWAEQVKNNTVAQDFLSPYNEMDYENFYNQYAMSKATALQYAEMYRERNERGRNQWITTARKHLQIIQQKKLFDLQCRWRAGQLELDGVEICYDFCILEQDIMNVGFLEKPSLEDINLYCDYLHEGNADLENDFFNEWQGYDEWKLAYQNDADVEQIPEWYEFHNMRTGNGILLTLPDVKGELEKMYMKLDKEAKEKIQPPVPTSAAPSRPVKPYLNYYDKQLHLKLARKIENKESIHALEEYVEATEYMSTYQYERAQLTFDSLLGIKDELVPIESHEDFRVALEKAYHRYECRKIAEHLPLALEQYQTDTKLRKMGIHSYSENSDDVFYKNIRKMMAESILRGRKLNNEPPDFNF